MAAPWVAPIKRALQSATFILCHAIAASVLIVAFTFLHILLERMGDPKMFDAIPLRYMIDAMDLMVFIIFVGFAAGEAIEAFGGDAQ